MFSFPPAPRLRNLSKVAAVMAVSALAVSVAPPANAAVTGDNLVANGTFDTTMSGWTTNHTWIKLKQSIEGRSGPHSAVLSTTRSGEDVILNDSPNTVKSTKKGTHYDVSAWVKSLNPKLSGQVRIREVSSGGAVQVFAKSFYLPDTAWTQVSFSFTTPRAGDSLDLSVLGWELGSAQRLYVDSVSLVNADAATAPTSPVDTDKFAKLSNGVSISSRGLPAKGALVGSAVGSNTDPAAVEGDAGRRLGIRRTYWGSGSVDHAVKVARADLAAGRLPWMSFKLPHSWEDMADGDGDAWAKDLTVKMSKLPGPVWIAFYHEPEYHGDVAQWKAMQERLGPIVRKNSSNVAFTVILTGYHQMNTPAYSLDKIFPNTKVDVAGFDIYNFYGTTNANGTTFTEPSNLRRNYFEPIGKWAASKGIAWGLAETGFNNAAASKYPNLMAETYSSMVDNGGVAFSYFNSGLNSSSTWEITTKAKMTQFTALLKANPTFPKLV
jgi:Carbohydrate binding domain